MPEISEQDFKALKDQVLALSNQLNAAHRRIQDLENFATDHIGLNWGEALVDINAPHPNISVNTIESGGGNIRQDANGMQVESNGISRASVYFVNKLVPSPTGETERAELVGSVDDTSTLTSLNAVHSGGLAGVLLGAASGTANADLTIFVSGWSAQPRAKLYPLTTNIGKLELQNAVLSFGGLASDPGTLTDGLMWYNTTSKQLKARVNGSTVVLA